MPRGAWVLTDGEHDIDAPRFVLESARADVDDPVGPEIPHELHILREGCSDDLGTRVRICLRFVEHGEPKRDPRSPQFLWEETMGNADLEYDGGPFQAWELEDEGDESEFPVDDDAEDESLSDEEDPLSYAPVTRDGG